MLAPLLNQAYKRALQFVNTLLAQETGARLLFEDGSYIIVE
jgi:hypothetical protein